MTNNIMNMDGSFKPFRAWCQLVLPQVYDDSLSYMELLNKVIAYINSFGEYLEEFTAINKVKYGGPWDVTKQYTPNTVVSVGDTGYMSIKPVPAGIDISNTDYWLKVADFAGQIVDLGIRVITLENKMTTVENDIDTLDTKVTEIEGNIEEINSSINSITDRVTDVENEDVTINNRIDSLIDTIDTLSDTIELKINNLNKISAIRNYNGRRIICISDSYGLMPSASTNWIATLQNITGLTSSDFFSNCHNGSGFIGLSDRPTFLELLQAINIDDANTITDVIISGGYNDAVALQLGNTDADMRAAIATFISYVNINIPNAKVSILPCCWCTHDYTVHKHIRQYINVLSQTTNYGKNAVYSDSALYCLHYTPFLDSTGFHPTSIGSDLIAESIASYLLGGTGYKCTPGANVTPTVTAVSPINSISFQNFRMIMDGPTVNLNSDLITMSGSINCNSGYYLKVANLSNTVMIGGYDTYEGYKIPCVGVDSTNHYFNMHLVIMRGEIHIQPLGYTLNNATSLAIFGVNYSGITML